MFSLIAESLHISLFYSEYALSVGTTCEDPDWSFLFSFELFFEYLLRLKP